jgi:CubicO group peptidase (beta-lactamase class C family)
MKSIVRHILFLLAVTLTACQVIAQDNGQTAFSPYWPTRGWRSATPEQQGMDSAKLAEALDYIREHHIKIHSLLLVRNGYIVLDAYFYPYDKASLHDVASVTKSITTGLIGIAIDQGKIQSLHQPVNTLFPNRQIAHQEARKERLSVEHLAMMSAGLDCQFEPGEPTLQQMRQSNDWTQFMLDLPMVAEPGEKYVYCSGGMHLLSSIITQATGMSALNFARQALFAPLGIKEVSWPADAQGVSHGWGDLQLHPRDMAKIGYLWLNRGMWDGQRIVSAGWVKESIRAHAITGRSNDYGYGWWMRASGKPFFYEAVGRGGQRISVVPEHDLIVVLTGGGFEPGDFSHLLLAAIKTNQPLPANRAAGARLAAAVLAAAQPPSSQSIAPLPSMAKTISGKAFWLDPNPVGFKSLSLRFTSAKDASVRLTFADNHTEEHPIGLDGRIRKSAGGRFNLPVGVMGYWENNEVFVLDYDEIANINHFMLRISFNGDRIALALTEKTSDFEMKLEGRLRSS